MNPAIIEVKNFKMSFGGRTVIEDLSFEVNQGEVFGFLGSNGSGKTTTIRALLGLYRPTGGELLVEGKPFSPQQGQRLGYLPEERGLYKKEPVLDTMVYFGQLKGMPRAEARQWSLQYLERVDLAHVSHFPIDKLSGGMQQKVQLGITMMHRPSLLILDEPTKGFDPVNRRLLMEMLEERVTDGATIVLVTHQMEEVERLCQRVLLLKDGRRRLYGSVEEIRRQFGSDEIAISFSGTLPDSPSYLVTQHSVGTAKLAPVGVEPQAVLALLVKQKGLRLTSYSIEQPSMDDIFVSIYKEATDA
jgi:ABC-2 type transport system ATP-binding protein